MTGLKGAQKERNLHIHVDIDTHRPSPEHDRPGWSVLFGILYGGTRQCVRYTEYLAQDSS